MVRRSINTYQTKKMNNKLLVRIAALVSITSIITELTSWPEVLFISNIVMIIIWGHMEYQIWKSER